MQIGSVVEVTPPVKITIKDNKSKAIQQEAEEKQNDKVIRIPEPISAPIEV